MEDNKTTGYKIISDHLSLKKIHESGQVLMGWECKKKDEYCIVSRNKKITARQLENGIEIDGPAEDETFWRRYFDMDTDYTAISQRYAEDDFLQRALSYGQGIRILRQDPWEALLSFIVSQNNNIPRITKSIRMLQGEMEFFPRPDELYEKRDMLSKCGLGYRDKYIERLLEDIKDGRQRLEFSNETSAARKELMSIYGIGAKVANCVLLFGMHRMDCCPVDTWMKKIFANHYNEAAPSWTKDEFAGYYQQVTFFYERSMSKRR